jgi:hypothetical protein
MKPDIKMKTNRIFQSVIFLFTALAAPLVFAGPKAPPVTFTGGDGSSFAKAIVIKGATEANGENAEFRWLAEHYPGYQNKGKAMQEQGGKKFDVIIIEVGKKKKTVYFDISEFFGK